MSNNSNNVLPPPSLLSSTSVPGERAGSRLGSLSALPGNACVPSVHEKSVGILKGKTAFNQRYIVPDPSDQELKLLQVYLKGELGFLDRVRVHINRLARIILPLTTREGNAARIAAAELFAPEGEKSKLAKGKLTAEQKQLAKQVRKVAQDQAKRAKGAAKKAGIAIRAATEESAGNGNVQSDLEDNPKHEAAQAHHLLATLYSTGERGFRKNYSLALAHFAIAGQYGNQEAATVMDNFNEKRIAVRARS